MFMFRRAAVLAFALTLLPGAAWAELIYGRVSKLDRERHSFTLTYQPPFSKEKTRYRVVIGPDTVFVGTYDLSQYENGQEAWVQAEKDEAAGVYRARKVTKA